MNHNAIAREFNENGYAIVPRVFAADEIAAMEGELAKVIRNDAPNMKAGDIYYEDGPGKAIKSMFRLNEHSELFKKLMVDQRLLALMKAIFTQGEILPSSVSFFGKAAHAGSVTPAHQDNAFQNRQPPDVLICTIAIDESTPENGALTVQKGSHKIGVQPHRASGVMGFSQTLVEPLDLKQYPEVELCMKPGDICLHHTNVVHRSGANTTAKSRRQLGIQYLSSLAQRDEAGWAHYQADLKKLHAGHATAVKA